MLRQSRAQMQQGSGNVFLDHLARDAQLPGNLDLAEATEAMQQKNPAALRGQFGNGFFYKTQPLALIRT